MILLNETQTMEPIELRIEKLLMALHVPAHLKGYRYLARAIAFTMEDESCLRSVMTALYGRIAKDFRTTVHSVERNARTAIHQIPKDAYQSVFTAGDLQDGRALTVSTFISLCVLKLRYLD